MLQKIACALVVLSAVLGARAETLTYVSSEEGGFYEFNVPKRFKNVNLAYVANARTKFLSSFGTYNTETLECETRCELTDDKAGYYYWANTGEKITFQLQWKCRGYLRGILVQAVQSGTDVLVSVIGRYYPTYDPYGTDFTAKGQTGDTWYTCYIPDKQTATEDLPDNTQGAPMALEDLQLIVSNEPQIELDEQWDGADSGIVAGDVLIWNGGSEGIWSGEATNWKTTDGAETRWVKGCVAKFPESAKIVVEGFKTVAGFQAAGKDLTFTGDEIRFTEQAIIQYHADGRVRFENAVAAENLIQAPRPQMDVVTKLDEVVYLSMDEEPQKVLPAGVSLANIGLLRFNVDSCWGGAQTRSMSNATPEYNQEGVYKWEYDASTGVATCQIKIQNGGGVCSCVKVQFEERDDGIYAKGVYARAAVGWGGVYTDLTWYNQNYKNVFEIDYDNGDYRGDAKLISQTDTIQNYHVRIYDFSSVVVDSVPTDITTEIAGRFVMSGTGALSISNGMFKTTGNAALNDGGTFAAKIQLGNEASLVFAAMTEQGFSSAVEAINGTSGSEVVFASESNIILDGRNCIRVPVSIHGTATLPEGGYQGYDRFYGCPGAHIRAGGVLNVNACYSGYGHSGANIICHAGGRVNYLTVQAAGSYDLSLTLDGGELCLVADYTDNFGSDNPGKKLTLSNGAQVNGVMMTWAWQASANELFVTGTSPSFFNAEKIRFGQSGTIAGPHINSAGNEESHNNMVEKISVADVTGDAEADFIVSSTFYLNPETNWDEDEYCGIEKTGAGTMLLTGTNSVLAGSLKVKEGTVAFGTHASGEAASLDGMALWMQGGTVDFGASESDFTELKLDASSTENAASTLVAQRGARVTFADSSTVEWTGEKLLVSGDWSKRTFRVGTTGDALTADQLAKIKAVRADGTERSVRLSSDGYLIPPWDDGLRIILR